MDAHSGSDRSRFSGVLQEAGGASEGWALEAEAEEGALVMAGMAAAVGVARIAVMVAAAGVVVAMVARTRAVAVVEAMDAAARPAVGVVFVWAKVAAARGFVLVLACQPC